jgi:hypothetical protein
MLSRVVPLRRKLCNQQRNTPGYDPDAPDAGEHPHGAHHMFNRLFDST